MEMLGKETLSPSFPPLFNRAAAAKRSFDSYQPSASPPKKLTGGGFHKRGAEKAPAHTNDEGHRARLNSTQLRTEPYV